MLRIWYADVPTFNLFAQQANDRVYDGGAIDAVPVVCCNEVPIYS